MAACGRLALPVAVATDVVNFANAADKPKAAVSIAGGWAGAAAGSALGPVGTIVGGAVGYLAGRSM